MEEELATQWEALSLIENEQGVVVISQSSKERMVQQGQHCLLAMIIAERPVNKEAFKNTMSKVWKCTSWMQFSEVRSNQYLVEFHLEQDLEQVLQGRPWSFDRWLVCLHIFDGKKLVKEIPFSMETFWVQAHNTPFASMNINVAQQIGNNIGKCLEVQADARGICWGEFIRMKVELDMTKPIQRGMFLTIDGKKSWIALKYERLPNLCFRCGYIKHNAQGCSATKTRSDKIQYGAWLRAPTTRFADGEKKKYGTNSSRHDHGEQPWKTDKEVRDDSFTKYSNNSPTMQTPNHTDADNSCDAPKFRLGSDGHLKHRDMQHKVTCPRS